MEWTLEIILVVLLGATLFQAVRLERALGAMKRDRASLESLVVGFSTSTSQAESGIQQLRAAADGTGRQIAAQLAKSSSIKDDLEFLTDRADRLADRLETLVRSGRPIAQNRQASERPTTASRPTLESPVLERTTLDRATPQRPSVAPDTGATRTASQAERDLLQALRMAR